MLDTVYYGRRNLLYSLDWYTNRSGYSNMKVKASFKDFNDISANYKDLDCEYHNVTLLYGFTLLGGT